MMMVDEVVNNEVENAEIQLNSIIGYSLSDQHRDHSWCPILLSQSWPPFQTLIQFLPSTYNPIFWGHIRLPFPLKSFMYAPLISRQSPKSYIMKANTVYLMPKQFNF